MFSVAKHRTLAIHPLLGALENAPISVAILGKEGPKQTSHLPE
jgi:hypothetical protein